MRDLLEGIIEFGKTSKSDAFIREEKKVCSAIQSALSNVYLNDGNEVELVEKTIETLNFNSNRYFKLESMFLHGNRSQIEFDYYGKRAKKELGDLLIVSTLTRRGTPLLQKLTIVQAKRNTQKPYSWGIDKEQLFFLSNWPEFKGVMGIFPKKRTLAIPDFSGCMGSYYLYREPGDFVFVSARELEKSLGSRKRITFDELLSQQPERGSIFAPSNSAIPLSLMDPKEVYYILEKYLYRYLKHGYIPSLHPYFGDNTFQILQNVFFSKNINDAISNFSRLNIGETIFAYKSAISVNDFAYRLLNTIIRYIVKTEKGRSGQLMEFNGDAPFFEDVDLRGINIGIVHTITEVSIG